jgi:hypothetical protein
MKNFPKAFAALAALSFVGTSAFAQLTVNGLVNATSCALGVTASATGAPTTSATIRLTDILASNARLALNGAVGPIQDAPVNTSFFVRPTSTSCGSTGTTGTFNVYFSTGSYDTNVATKAANTSAVGTRASNLVIDLVPTGGTTVAPLTSGMDMTQTTPATQHGLAAAPISTGATLNFNARYYKTTTAATSGSTVTAVYTLNGVYP